MTRLTREEYLPIERKAEWKSEFIHGELRNAATSVQSNEGTAP